jgi:hypothetical protein
MKRQIWILVSLILAVVAMKTARSADESQVVHNMAESEASHVLGPKYWTLRLDDSGKPLAKEGHIEWVEGPAPKTAKAPLLRKLAGNEATAHVSCRTTPTSTDRVRHSCSDSEVHTLPEGYVFVENEVRKDWHSRIGSENSVNVVFEDRVEIIPGTGIMMARTMRVEGHARSGKDPGERGHTDCTVTCRFVGYGH